MGLMERWKKLPILVRLGLMLLVILLETWFIIWIRQYDQQRDKNERAYLTNHHCERTGFVGKNPQAVYKCDNGLWLQSEIRENSSNENAH